MVRASKAMQQVYDLIERSAQTDSTVLITGESGTGKELVARAVHFNGIRKRAPFISINCLALPENLLESELFGHEPGAFTEDLETKEGKFELADEGTIFLDEIGDLSSTLQVKLLRFLQEKEFERVGGSKTIKMNVRCIAATNRNLDTAMQEGTFREELYFRLNVFNIAVPALRDRREDIPLLVEYLIKKKAHQLKIPIKPVSTSAEKKLLNYSYPGNIRELENLLERALIVSRNRSIRAEDLVLSNVAYRGGDSQENLSQIYNLPLEKGWHHLQEINKNLERELLLRALTIHRDANNSEIAALLGTTRRILELRLKLFGLDKA
jgi:DNA-binding NtrC family response regulator